MELSGRVRILESSGFGVWRVEAIAKDLEFLGDSTSRAPGRSILGLKGYKLSEAGDFLVFQLKDVSVFSLGDLDDCVAVAFEGPKMEQLPEDGKGLTTDTLNQSTHARIQKFGSGDEAFIAACRFERLPDRIIKLGQEFLKRIREFSGDDLREGKSRKWVTYPKNFLALTIQNRNQQFCVHVKKSPLLNSLSESLDVRDDRPGYARFWLQDESQLESAVRAAKGSFGL